MISSALSSAKGRPFAVRTLTLSVALVAALFAGCSEEEEVDPYVYGTLDQVTRGHVESAGFLFEIDPPEFVLIEGNTGIARVGNHLEVIVADDLENRVAGWEGKKIGVKKNFSPFVWLEVQRTKDLPNPEDPSTAVLDTLPTIEDPLLPKFASVDLEEVSGFDLGSLRWNRKQQIDDMFEAEVQGVGVVVQRPDHEFEAEADTVETPMAWYLEAEGSDAVFKITNVTPSLELAFKMLEIDNLPFIGGVRILETYPFAQRRATRVSAPVEITFVRYANRYLAP